MDGPDHVYPGGTRRREFLRLCVAGVAGVSLGGFLPRASRAAECKPGGPFNLFTWQGYEGVGIPAWDEFYAKNKIALNMKPLGFDNLVQILKGPGGDQWDSFSVNQADTIRFRDLKLLAPITVEDVPELAHMHPAFADNPLFKISDGVYSCVPLTAGALGLNWVEDKHPKGFTSYADALNPDVRVGCINSSSNMVSAGACAVGLDPGKLTREGLTGPVKEWLMKARPQMKVISASLGDQLTVLINDEVDLQLIGLTWFIAQGAQQGVKIGFSLPSEGTFGFVDSIALTPSAPHRCNTIAYCNAALDPKTAAPLQDSLVQVGPTPAINAAIDPKIRAYFPADLDKDYFSKLKWNVAYTDQNGEYATIEEWDKVWNDVKLAG